MTLKVGILIYHVRLPLYPDLRWGINFPIFFKANKRRVLLLSFSWGYVLLWISTLCGNLSYNFPSHSGPRSHLLSLIEHSYRSFRLLGALFISSGHLQCEVISICFELCVFCASGTWKSSFCFSHEPTIALKRATKTTKSVILPFL